MSARAVSAICRYEAAPCKAATSLREWCRTRRAAQHTAKVRRDPSARAPLCELDRLIAQAIDIISRATSVWADVGPELYEVVVCLEHLAAAGRQLAAKCDKRERDKRQSSWQEWVDAQLEGGAKALQ